MAIGRLQDLWMEQDSLILQEFLMERERCVLLLPTISLNSDEVLTNVILNKKTT